jgi:hypothetical protein
VLTKFIVMFYYCRLSVEAVVDEDSAVTSSHRGGSIIWSSSVSWTSSSGSGSSGTRVSYSSLVDKPLK